MTTKISTKGQTVIPERIRELANLAAGDELDVGYSDGMIILRKRQPLDAKLVRSMLLAGRALPTMREVDETGVEKAIRRVRRRVAK